MVPITDWRTEASNIDRKALLVLHQEGNSATAIARKLSIARSTVYKILEDKKVD